MILAPVLCIRSTLSWNMSESVNFLVDRYAVSIIGPFFVTSIVCSNCAVRLLSFVTAVQPSSSISNSTLPSLITGSASETSFRHQLSIFSSLTWDQINVKLGQVVLGRESCTPHFLNRMMPMFGTASY